MGLFSFFRKKVEPLELVECQHEYTWKLKVIRGFAGLIEVQDCQTGTCSKCGFKINKEIQYDFK